MKTKTMAKRSCFSDREQILLKELVSDKINIVESKKTDYKAISAKKNVWSDISKDFNAFDNVSRRTDKQLKKCWDNMKTRAKNKTAVERRERLLTGGGKITDTADDSERQIQAMVAPQIDPMRNPFDADAGPDDVESNDEETDITKTATTSDSSSNTTSGSGVGSDSVRLSTAQQKVLDRQELEHKARMKLIERKREMAEDKHELKMKYLLLKITKLEEEGSDPIARTSRSTQTPTPVSVRQSFSIDSLVNN